MIFIFYSASICSLHFAPDAYRQCNLKNDAIPTLLLGPEHPDVGPDCLNTGTCIGAHLSYIFLKRLKRNIEIASFDFSCESVSRACNLTCLLIDLEPRSIVKQESESLTDNKNETDLTDGGTPNSLLTGNGKWQF